MKKYYAIKEGYKTGVFYDEWANVKQYISGYSGAVYKGFKNQKEADDYMADDGNTAVEKVDDNTDNVNKEINKEIEEMGSNEVIAFVDGTYKNNIEGKYPEKYGYGVILLTKPEDKILEDKLYNSAHDEEGLRLRQVAGELQATKEAINWAIAMEKFSKIHIFYDYSGIENWANRTWKAKDSITEEYADFIQKKSNLITITFSKVTSHTGIGYNEKADKLAKSSLEGGAYKTNNDGSIYLKGLSSSLWGEINEELKKKVGDSLKIAERNDNRFPQIIFQTNESKVTVTIYENTNSAYLQGTPCNLLNELFDLAVSKVKTDKDALLALNYFHSLSIKEDELDIKYREQLPKASKVETDGSVVRTLKNAVYNTMLTGYKPDYTDLISPVTRIMEHYLHEMIGRGGLETECVSHSNHVTNKFNYFNFSTDTNRYTVSSGQLKQRLTESQIQLLESIYNWYHKNRHATNHWNKESEDTTMIPTMTIARDLILEGESLIEKFYDLF